MSLSKDMRFRQIHLDFHTSEHIKGVGSEFDKKEFQQTLLNAKVNSITCFFIMPSWLELSSYQSRQNPPLFEF